jgi:DNA polymerase III delta prime subunit
MLHAYLIIGNSAEQIKLEIDQITRKVLGRDSGLNQNPDILTFESQTSLKIADIRHLQKEVQFRPYQSKHKVIIINHAGNLTLPAQNALLKTLEEPPESTILILTAASKESLLPTILSRCQLIQINQPADTDTLPEQIQLLQQIIKGNAGERLLIADGFSKDKKQALEFCLNQIKAARQLNSENNTGISTIIISLIFESIQQLEANVNPSLIIGNLLLSYPDWDKI